MFHRIAFRLVEQLLASQRVLPVIRGASALDIARRLLESGMSMIELTTTIPSWESVMATVRRDFPEATVGMGTVATPAQSLAAQESGAQFLVSPWPARGVREAASVPFFEGGFTPAEVAAASGFGIAKLFPAHVGGPAYLRSILAVSPGARIIPTGGIQPSEVDEWLAAGALAVGIGADRLLAGGRS
jgi:2-dehydro-3-deoxyphosphogluconate aldolase/(4S)-4-hydroxy-2-oxoglutarate aldolase